MTDGKESLCGGLGLGSFGAKLAVALARAGNTVLVVDIDQQRVDDLRDKVTEAIIADVSNEEVVRELNVRKFDAVILGMSSHFEDQVLALTLLKQEGVRKVIVKANTTIQERILFRLGADEVFQPEQDVAERLARRLTMDNITDLFEFKGSAIAEVTVPEQLSGRSLRQLDLRNRFNVTVLLMRKPGGSAETVMTPDTLLEKGDQLTVFGSQKSIIELFKEK